MMPQERGLSTLLGRFALGRRSYRCIVDGAQGQIGGVTHDSQCLMESTFDAAPVPIAVVGPSGESLRINDALRKLLIVGAETSPDIDQRILACVNGMFSEIRHRFAFGDLDHYETEHLAVLPSANQKRLQITATAVRSIDNSIEQIVAHVQSIDESHGREQRAVEDRADRTVARQIRRALEDDRFLLYAQPIVELRTGSRFAEELLLRMRDPAGNIVGPHEFLPVAERTGLITAIDSWVTEQAIQIAAAGRTVEINVSGRSLGDSEFEALVENALRHYAADPRRVVFEVTETAMIENLRPAQRFAEHVTELGCRVALDDFGTGFCTLTTAKALPVSLIKIDIEFISDLLTNRRSECIVRSVINFAQALGAMTVAEGVEDQETLAKLQELQVDYAQGYLLGRPMPMTCSN